MPEDLHYDSFRERHLARLLITLYYCGTPVTSLLEGDTRQIDSPARLGRFDFWMREPGHLALALLDAFATAPASVGVDRAALASAMSRMTADAELDRRRVTLHASTPRSHATLDAYLSHLTGAALVTDRPSFSKSQPHQIALETPGIAIVEKIFAACPSFAWHKAQGELIAACFPTLERYDLANMSYLAPDLTATLAMAVPLTPFVLARAQRVGLPLTPALPLGAAPPDQPAEADTKFTVDDEPGVVVR